MQYITHYQSPVGDILLAADETGLTGLWFDGQKYYADRLDPEHEEKDTPVLAQARLFSYLSGKSFKKYLTEKPLLMEKSQRKLQNGKDFPEYRHRRQAAQ